LDFIMKRHTYREDLQVAEKKTSVGAAARPTRGNTKPAGKAPPETASKSVKKTAIDNSAPAAANRPAAPRPDTDAMNTAQLAKAVLTGEIRPRIGEVKRLAEAVVAKPPSKKAKKAKKAERKLAKIPGQKKKKKKK
jgi:hypothetical protein